MTSRNHLLFQSHTMRNPVQISTGEVSVPYQIYDGYGALIGGTADLAMRFYGGKSRAS
jgi:hypothetical protein